jgi:hypothetical protein
MDRAADPAGGAKAPKTGVRELTERPIIRRTALVLPVPTSSATGEFFNAGYEWRWSSGLGILLGGGINHLCQVKATNGVETVETPGGTNPNLEVGLRYMFL